MRQGGDHEDLSKAGIAGGLLYIVGAGSAQPRDLGGRIQVGEKINEFHSDRVKKK
jgi:hypothetical protein